MNFGAMISSTKFIPNIFTGGCTVIHQKRNHNGEVVQTTRKVSADQFRKLQSQPKQVRLRQECVRCTDLLRCIDFVRTSVESRKPIPNKRLIELVEWIKLYNKETGKEAKRNKAAVTAASSTSSGTGRTPHRPTPAMQHRS